MNNREQYLKKQIERRDDQIRVLMTAFNNLLAENEFLMSVACGFAWDLVTTEYRNTSFLSATLSMIEGWEIAVAAMEKQNEEKS